MAPGKKRITIQQDHLAELATAALKGVVGRHEMQSITIARILCCVCKNLLDEDLERLDLMLTWPCKINPVLAFLLQEIGFGAFGLDSHDAEWQKTILKIKEEIKARHDARPIQEAVQEVLSEFVSETEATIGTRTGQASPGQSGSGLLCSEQAVESGSDPEKADVIGGCDADWPPSFG